MTEKHFKCEKDFHVAVALSEKSGATIPSLAKKTGYSEEDVIASLASLRNGGYAENDRLTSLGLETLEGYRVENAIILAAGMATRFVPISYEIPKGLIRVKGEPLIERQICQLKEAGINEIVVVLGYMMEKFLYLKDKYNVKFVVNNEFAEKNTHSSIYAARDYLKNTLILCADNYYPNNMFHKYEYRTYYCSIFLPGIGYTERSLVTDENGLVVDTHKPSRDEWILYGHAYWDRSFSAAFKPILKRYYGTEGIENYYWETIWSENLESCPMWIKRCTPEDIMEFDSVSELEAYDKDYILNNDTSIMENIRSVLYCTAADITDFKPLKTGLNNRSFTFLCKGQRYVYRHPGKNAEGVIDRKKEAFCQRCARDLGIDETLIYIDSVRGWKISKYIDTTEEFDFSNVTHVEALAQHLKNLHDANIVTNTHFSYMEEADKLIEIIRRVDYDSFVEIQKNRERIQKVLSGLAQDNWQVSLCHNDIYEPNLLVSNGIVSLIDWEFAGDSDIGYDICKLFAVLNPAPEQYDNLLYLYYHRKATAEEKHHLIGCAAVLYYYWFVWGVYASKNGTSVSDYVMVWYDKMKHFCELYEKGKDSL